MIPRISVRLYVTGEDLDMAGIEAAVGTAPTGTWRKGEPLERARRVRKQDGWVLERSFQASYLLDERLDEIRRMLEARTGIIRDFCDLQNYQLEIACVVEMYDETAGMHLSRDVIAWLHGLGASLEIDTYMVAE